MDVNNFHQILTRDLLINKNRKLVIELQIMVGPLWKKKQCSILNCFPYINNEIKVVLFKCVYTDALHMVYHTKDFT